MGSLYVSCPGASCFQYAAANATAGYSVEDDVNVGPEEEVVTTPTMPDTIRVQLRAGDGSLEKIPALTRSELETVETRTIGQCNNPVWLEQRCGRITASVAHMTLTKARKIRSGQQGNMDTLTCAILGEKSPPPDLPALKYGRHTEPVARDRYVDVMHGQGHSSISVRECGLFVHPEHSYMAASPDGVVACECCGGEGLLEIKCPYSLIHTDPQTCPPAYLTRSDSGQLSLKLNHPYHTQVIMQLAVTGHEWCDFFVYTPKGHHLQRIHRSDHLELVSELQQAAKTVFTGFVIPKLLASAGTVDVDSQSDSANTTHPVNTTSVTGKKTISYLIITCFFL